jgi:hypothetical protein
MRIEETDKDFPNNKVYLALKNVIDRLLSQPTARNEDKVIAQLQELRNIASGYNSETYVMAMDRAIEIVKKGGIDNE